eukprot:jgi/Chrzof1/5554/Cz16g07110.t1
MGDLAASSGAFCNNEKVLVCVYTDKYYEAKVLRSEVRGDGMRYYLLHYTGWNKKWDEWVEETGLQKCPQGTQTHNNGKKGPKSGTATRRRRPEGGEPFPGEPADLHVEIDIPPPLKKQLLDDYDAVHDEGKYIPLPRHPNVGEIAQQYVSYVRDRQAAADIEDEIVAGLKMYFDKTLTHCLLYKHEQAQANKVLADGRIPSSVYGAEHFLRLFVKLPEFLPHTGLTEGQMQLLTNRIEDVLRFLQYNQPQLFLSKDKYLVSGAASVPQRA